MINRKNFIYSKAAAARILGVEREEIARFEVWAYVCFVHVRGQRPTFISKKAFTNHFAEWRKQQAEKLTAGRYKDNIFVVINHQKATKYDVYVWQDSLDCSCYDYQNQVNIFAGKIACCKHCYSVLNHLGFSNLRDYIEHHRWAS
jgi:vacuolar-type H+-ATPase subunit I/STV1